MIDEQKLIEWLKSKVEEAENEAENAKKKEGVHHMFHYNVGKSSAFMEVLTQLDRFEGDE